MPCLLYGVLYWIRGSSTNHNGHLLTGMGIISLYELLHGVVVYVYRVLYTKTLIVIMEITSP